MSPEAQDKIDAALFGGDPKLTLAPGRLSTPTLDLAFEGEASAVAGEPRGRLVVSADGLDKALALLNGKISPETSEVREVAMHVLQHRVITNYRATGAGKKSRDIVQGLLTEVPEQNY